MNTLEATLAVVLPVKLSGNRRECLARCLESLLRARQSSTRWGRVVLVVVDDGSEPPLSESLPAKLLREIRLVTNRRSPGQAGALNHALRETPADVYAFTDSDCVVAPNWIEVLAEEYAAEPAPPALAGPNWIHLPARGLRARWLTRQESHLGRFNFEKYVDASKHCSRFDCRNFSIRRAYLDELVPDGAPFFVEGAGPSVSGLTSLRWRPAFERAANSPLFCARLGVSHEPVTGMATQVGRYFRWGWLGAYSTYYREGDAGLFMAFARRHFRRHFIAPVIAGVSPWYVWAVHAAYWLGIAFENVRARRRARSAQPARPARIFH
jgi:glycosyltransferase involved in cell wall biosynthesis